jgi:predicted amidohydrolase YtcJ
VTPDKLKGVTGAGTNPDGSSNGQFLGTNAARLILPEVIAELMKPEAAKKNLTYFGSLMQQAGVTTVGDLFYGGVNLELEQSLSKSFYDNDEAWARIVHVVDGYTLSELYGDDAVDKALEMRGQSTDRTIFNGVKFYADDAFLSLAMELQWPGYINPEKYHGLFMYKSKDDFVSAMRPWWHSGFQIHVHANGSGGNQLTLDALADLQEEKPRFDHRFTFEHFGISTTAQGRRLKALGASVSTNPYYVYERADLTIPEIGTDRASLASRMKTLVDQDIAVSLHSDTPVGVPSPLLEVWIAVNRIGFDSGKVRAPAERVDVARAMRMVTVDAAYTLGQEDNMGSIETGKFADFAVLDADPQEVDAMKIKDIGVVATILGGRVTLTADTRKPQ